MKRTGPKRTSPTPTPPTANTGSIERVWDIKDREVVYRKITLTEDLDSRLARLADSKHTTTNQLILELLGEAISDAH